MTLGMGDWISDGDNDDLLFEEEDDDDQDTTNCCKGVCHNVDGIA